MNSYVITFLDMNTKNVHTATAKFCLRPSYKRIPSHKMFASDGSILPYKSLQKDTQIAKKIACGGHIVGGKSIFSSYNIALFLGEISKTQCFFG